MINKDSSDTRARIMAASQALFAREGYDATGVADICETAGVSKGAFYHHFPTKQDVFIELLNEWLSGLDVQINRIMRESVDVPSGLLNLADLVDTIHRAADGRLSMFLEIWTQSSRNPEFWKVAIAPYRRYVAMFEQIVQRGIVEGTIKPVEAELAGRVIVALAMGLILQGLFDPEALSGSTLTRRGLELLLDGMRKRQSE